MRAYKFRIIIEKDEDNVCIASCPSLNGCYSQGATIVYEKIISLLNSTEKPADKFCF
jgi:hypothetical protein